MAWKSIILDEPNAHNNILLLVCPRLICYIPVFLRKAYSFHVSMMIIAIILKIWLQTSKGWYQDCYGLCGFDPHFSFWHQMEHKHWQSNYMRRGKKCLVFCWTTFFLKELIKNWVFSLAAAVHTRTPPTTRVREVYKGQGNVKLKAEYPKVSL